MTSEQKVFRADEVKAHKDAKSSWLIIHNRVYDVTKFLDEVSVFFSPVLAVVRAHD